ncbi:hypothetical protein DPX16_14014 [Anabarilius grahami]|uniref:C-type lectin domain-containing protein n=1 Tax=Anabarilius grahami TaxID=495550 RepID=A0A3N0Y8X7_ANAGA|nr:hypothetical protein DPX16_14014 [Anabarilius grahami]
MYRNNTNLDQFIWSDGDLQTDFYNWKLGQPNERNSNQNCVEVDGNGWADYGCENDLAFFCYMTLQRDKKTWEEAVEHCRDNYTELASLTDNEHLQQAENNLIGETSVWVGLRFGAGQWYWLNAEPVGIEVSLPWCPAIPYRYPQFTLWTPPGNSNMTLEWYLDSVLRWCGSPNTVSEVNFANTNTILSQPSQHTPALLVPIIFISESIPVFEDSEFIPGIEMSESGPVRDIPESCPIMAALPESHPIMAALPESRPIMVALPESHPVMAALPEYRPVMAALPESHLVMAAISESRPVMATTPELFHPGGFLTCQNHMLTCPGLQGA